MALGRTAKYYRENPEAAEKHRAYQRELNKKPSKVAYRVELNKKNREADKKGIDRNGKDYDHATKSYVKKSVNRGRNSKNGGTKGDIKARG